LAMGAAFWANHLINGIHSYPLDDLFLGPGYRDDEINKALEQSGLEYSRVEDIEDEAAKLIAMGYIVFWFQGKMEYGPRALGGRSILALPDSNRIRNLLNLRLKMRVWYQPFCPTMRIEDAQKYLTDYDGPNPFMTMGYMIKEDKRSEIEGVISVDGSSRPQVINSESSKYGRLIRKIAELTGRGVILNTSFNIHGEPLVCSPADAIDTFKRTKNEYMVMGNYLVKGLKL
jgi:carbamoyltransferase